jgi:hypothetical protein
MFTNKMKAIELCVSRFDTETKATFLDLYTKIDATPVEEELEAVDVEDEDLEPIAFDDFSKPDTNEKAF